MGDISEVVWLLKQYGPLLLATIFFVWKDWKREDRLSDRIDQLENEQREVILPLVRKCTRVITRCSTVMRQNTHVMVRIDDALKRQPPCQRCIEEANHVPSRS